MLTEDPSRAAKPVPTPAPPGDHRKRRRNRTTQSCLNCHASKRMCDRKRPACQRCTTLGLTGLCVYEVDDPSQRPILSDEKALLRNRVAELEGVIREMKNKPHPRWTQKPPDNQANDTPSNDTTDGDAIMAPIPTEVRSSDVHGDQVTSNRVSRNSQLNPPSIQLTPVPVSSGSSLPCDSPLTPQDPHFLTAFNLPSPPNSSPSPSPANSHRSLPRVALNDSRPINPSVFNVDNLLASACLEPTGFEEGIYGHMLDHIMQTDQASAARACSQNTSCSQSNNCGCVDNAMVYNNLLELSVRLRKAVESLGGVTSHQERGFESECHLYKKICELDKLTSTTLGNTTSPADRHATDDSYFTPLSADFISSTISPNCLINIQQWESAVPRSSISGNTHDDSLMSWDGPSSENWPHVARS